MIATLCLACTGAEAQTAPLALAAEAAQGQSYTLSIQILVLMTLLTLLPAAILSTSAFVRIIIVLVIVMTIVLFAECGARVQRLICLATIVCGYVGDCKADAFSSSRHYISIIYGAFVFELGS